MKVSILGCGRWGTFLAWYSSHIGHETTLWGRSGSKRLDALQQNRSNEYLSLDGRIKITDDLYDALTSQTIIISISAQSLRDLLENISSYPIEGKTFVLCMKGLEVDSGKRLSEVFLEVIGNRADVAVWLGPGHVQSFVKGVPNCMVIDAYSEEVKEKVINAFSSELIRFYYGNDIIGNEIGAATKNVIGIAAGLLDGAALTSLKGALMARAPREIAKLIKALGGDDYSAYGLSHLGDYEATLFSPHSHNRRFGEAYMKKEPFEKLAEGIPTLHAVKRISNALKVDLPICNSLYSVIIEGRDASSEISKLFLRPIKQEFIHD